MKFKPNYDTAYIAAEKSGINYKVIMTPQQVADLLDLFNSLDVDTVASYKNPDGLTSLREDLLDMAALHQFDARNMGRSW